MKIVNLGEVADFVNGYSFKPSDWMEDGLKIIRIQNLTDPTKKFNRTTKLIPEKYRVRKGDILVSWSATLDVFDWQEDDAWLNQHIFKVEHDDDLIDKYYFKYVLKHSIEEMMRYTHGSTMKHIVRKDFLNHKIPLPSLGEQKKIIKILDQANVLRQKRKQAIQLLDEYLNSVFFDMFGDPVTNSKKWDIQKLGDIADIASGVTKGRKLNNLDTLVVPYMRVANVQDGYINLKDVKNIEVLLSEVEKYRLLSGDLLLTEGGDPDKLGRGGIWEEEIKDCIHQNHIFRVRLSKQLVTPEYMSAQIGSLRGKNYFLRSAKQTTGIATINMTQLKSFPALIPPLNLQIKYAISVKKIAAIKKKMLTQSTELENQFQSLMQKAFKGEL